MWPTQDDQDHTADINSAPGRRDLVRSASCCWTVMSAAEAGKRAGSSGRLALTSYQRARAPAQDQKWKKLWKIYLISIAHLILKTPHCDGCKNF